MRFEEKVRILSRMELFETLPPGQIRRLGAAMPMIGLAKGQLLHGPGYRGSIFYFVLRGRMRMYKAFGAGEMTLRYAVVGDVLGEDVFGDVQGPRGAYAQAVEDSEVALMRVEAFRRLAREEPEVALKLIELLGRRVRFYADRIADIGTKDVVGRLATLIRHLVENEGLVTGDGYKLSVRYTHQQLGETIGAGRVAVTRALKELREAGAVAVERRQIRVRDPGVLHRISEGW